MTREQDPTSVTNSAGLGDLTDVKPTENSAKEKNYETTQIYYFFYVYGSVHHNIFYEITNRCNYMQSILFHC